MAEAGIKIQGESEEGSSQSPQSQADKYEVAARKSGWKPEEDWDGSPEDWVPAKEFIGRQKLYDKIHDLKRESTKQAQRFEQDMARISQHFAEVQQTEFKRAKKELEAQLAHAKRAEDVEAVAEIAGEIKEVEANAKAAATQATQAKKAATQGNPTPEFEEWQTQNTWFNKDAEMTADAIAIGTGYAAANPGKNQKDVLEHTAKKIKRMYPEFFEDAGETNKRGKVEDNRVEGGGNTRPAPKKKGQVSVGDLSDMERSVMKTLIKRGALKEVAAKNKRTEQEEYLAQLSERRDA